MQLRIHYSRGDVSRLLWRSLDFVERLQSALSRMSGDPGQEESRREQTLRQLLGYRRKAATLALAALALFLAFRVVFGTNGTLAYKKKREEYRVLQGEVQRLKKDNLALAEQNKSLKSDPDAIEREAREQLRYAKPGEVILMMPGADGIQAPADADARKR
jgi:cell division protein FtsB